MYLYAFGFENLFKPSSCSLDVWDHNDDIPVLTLGGGGVVCQSGVNVVVGLVVPLTFLLKLVRYLTLKLTSL